MSCASRACVLDERVRARPRKGSVLHGHPAPARPTWWESMRPSVSRTQHALGGWGERLEQLTRLLDGETNVSTPFMRYCMGAGHDSRLRPTSHGAQSNVSPVVHCFTSPRHPLHAPPIPPPTPHHALQQARDAVLSLMGLGGSPGGSRC